MIVVCRILGSLKWLIKWISSMLLKQFPIFHLRIFFMLLIASANLFIMGSPKITISPAPTQGTADSDSPEQEWVRCSLHTAAPHRAHNLSGTRIMNRMHVFAGLIKAVYLTVLTSAKDLRVCVPLAPSLNHLEPWSPGLSPGGREKGLLLSGFADMPS